MNNRKILNEAAPLALGLLKGLAYAAVEEVPGSIINFQRMIDRSESEEALLFIKKYGLDINHTLKIFYRKLRKSVQAKPDKYFTMSREIVGLKDENLEEFHRRIIDNNYSVLKLISEQTGCDPGEQYNPVTATCTEVPDPKYREIPADDEDERRQERRRQEREEAEIFQSSGAEIKSAVLSLIPFPGLGDGLVAYQHIPFLAAMSPGFANHDAAYDNDFSFEKDFSETAVKNFARSISRTVRKKFQCENRFAAVMVIVGYAIEDYFNASAEQYFVEPSHDPGTSEILLLSSPKNKKNVVYKMTDVGTIIRRYYVDRFYDLSQQPPHDDLEVEDYLLLNTPVLSWFTSEDSVTDRCGKPVSGNVEGSPIPPGPTVDSDGEIETSQYGTPVTRDGAVSPPGNFGRAEKAGLPSPKF